MKNDKSIDLYNKLYLDINFERAGLFEVVRNKYKCFTAIYPGCSVHITPSFYFQHVVYVDISQASRDFFNHTQSILDFVNTNKIYKQPAYVQFLENDYTGQLPLRENNYDLLIALYAEGITQSCKKYVKPGGIILTNNHHNAIEALNDPLILLDALIRRKGKGYSVVENVNVNFQKSVKEYSKPIKIYQK